MRAKEDDADAAGGVSVEVLMIIQRMQQKKRSSASQSFRPVALGRGRATAAAPGAQEGGGDGGVEGGGRRRLLWWRWQYIRPHVEHAVQGQARVSMRGGGGGWTQAHSVALLLQAAGCEGVSLRAAAKEDMT